MKILILAAALGLVASAPIGADHTAGARRHARACRDPHHQGGQAAFIKDCVKRKS